MTDSPTKLSGSAAEFTPSFAAPAAATDLPPAVAKADEAPSDAAAAPAAAAPRLRPGGSARSALKPGGSARSLKPGMSARSAASASNPGKSVAFAGRPDTNRTPPPAAPVRAAARSTEYKPPAWAAAAKLAAAAKAEGSSAADSDAAAHKLVASKANSILNKLTLEKFDKLSDDFIQVGFTTPGLLAVAIDLVLAKAQSEAHFTRMYAQLCLKLSTTAMASFGEGDDQPSAKAKGKQFRKTLLGKCEAGFFKSDSEVAALEAELGELTAAEREERETAEKKKYIGHMRFVGELYRVDLLSDKIMHGCVQELFGADANDVDEIKLDCLTKLMGIVGEKLEAGCSTDKRHLKFMKR